MCGVLAEVALSNTESTQGSKRVESTSFHGRHQHRHEAAMGYTMKHEVLDQQLLTPNAGGAWQEPPSISRRLLKRLQPSGPEEPSIMLGEEWRCFHLYTFHSSVSTASYTTDSSATHETRPSLSGDRREKSPSDYTHDVSSSRQRTTSFASSWSVGHGNFRQESRTMPISHIHRSRAIKPPTWAYVEAPGGADVRSRQSEHHTQGAQG